MASINKVILMGRLTADPELKQTGSGIPVTNFTIAVERKYGRGEEKQTDFPTIIAWRQTAEFICKHFKKGSMIIIEDGELQTRSWADQQGNKRYATEVVASEVSFGESKKNSETNYASQNQNAVQSDFGASGGYIPDAYMSNAPSAPDFGNAGEEDLPF